MEQIKLFWKGLTKRGKILFSGIGAIVILIILNWIF